MRPLVVVARLGDRTQHGVERAGDVGVAVVGGMLVQERGGGGRNGPAGA